MSWSSGTNTIKEGDESKSLTLQMLEVKKQGGGTELFVRKADVSLGTKSVNQNGTYTAAADSKYGFSQFSVNVAGGNGSADSHGKPSGTLAPGGSGSAVIGTNPETGNDEVVGVDENGQLVTTPVPSGIEIVMPPTKTAYTYQETMDYSGMVVKMVNRDGTTFTDVDHPNGHLALGELIFPVTAAPAASGEAQWSDDRGINAVKLVYNVQTDPPSSHPTWNGRGGTAFGRKVNGGQSVSLGKGPLGTTVLLTLYDGYYRVYGLDLNGAGEVGSNLYDVETGSLAGGTSSTIKQYVWSSSSWNTRVVENLIVPVSTADPNTSDPSDMHQVGGTATIPVKWINPYTGDTHQDTFEITSTPSGSSSSTTTGSAGQEGSGGGGTF